ncbi:PH domain-containing protein [Microbacterium indicum]|uniref:PH domain-containing protein n=1 Tax=Microbacterium indicum TaxID=358100 RepID=UPI0003FCBC52|nr:PH domain-containing protein [Microbacterium indicum]
MTDVTGEVLLARVRTHPKMLFWPAVLQLALIAIHVVIALFWPRSTGVAWFDEWGQAGAHVVVAIVEIIYFVVPLSKWWCTVFTLTNLRVERRWGVIWKRSREIPLARITSVEVQQGLLDRIFGCGTIVFHDAAIVPPADYGPLDEPTGDGPMVGVRFLDVPRVRSFRGLVDQARFGQSAPRG